MQLSAAGLNLIKRSEGFRSHTYLDAAGIPTIGYGHRLVHPECYPGPITEAQAEVILLWDVQDTSKAVERLVKTVLTQGQFDALVDFTFNLGWGRLAGSTLLEDLNHGKLDSAATQLLRWDHTGDHEVASLKARREAEFRLWSGNATETPAAA